MQEPQQPHQASSGGRQRLRTRQTQDQAQPLHLAPPEAGSGQHKAGKQLPDSSAAASGGSAKRRRVSSIGRTGPAGGGALAAQRTWRPPRRLQPASTSGPQQGTECQQDHQQAADGQQLNQQQQQQQQQQQPQQQQPQPLQQLDDASSNSHAGPVAANGFKTAASVVDVGAELQQLQGWEQEEQQQLQPHDGCEQANQQDCQQQQQQQEQQERQQQEDLQYSNLQQELQQQPQLDQQQQEQPQQQQIDQQQQQGQQQQQAQQQQPQFVLQPLGRMRPRLELQQEPHHLLASSYLPGSCLGSGVLHNRLYEWQAECLRQPQVEAGHNLVICAPTSAGKSLVADVLVVQSLRARPDKMVLTVMPTNALCQQRTSTLDRLLKPLNRQVGRAFHGMHSDIVNADTGVVIATIERANMLVTRLMESDPYLTRLGLVVVDELHLLGDDRGCGLELLLNKVRFAGELAKAQQAAAVAEHQQQQGLLDAYGLTQGVSTAPNYTPSLSSTPRGGTPTNRPLQPAFNPVRIVGMSATLPNAEEVAEWLDAVLFCTSFMPVALREYVLDGLRLMSHKGEVVRTLAVPQGWPSSDDNHVALLVNETVQERRSVLVFNATVSGTVSTAQHLARILKIPEDEGKQPGLTRRQLCEQLQALSVPQHSRAHVQDLVKLVSQGVAFYSAKLPSDAKDLVARGFKTGLIRALCSTTALAHGINLPAKRCIIKDTYVAFDTPENHISPIELKQMSGRAGRAGADSEGESIVLVRPDGRNRQQVQELLQAAYTPLKSALSDTQHLTHALCEAISMGVVSTLNEVEAYMSCSLLATERPTSVKTEEALRWLLAHGFIRLSADAGAFAPTQLGRAAAFAGMSPRQALGVQHDLDLALTWGLVSGTDLHVMYLVTPTYSLDKLTPNWHSLAEMCRLAQQNIQKARAALHQEQEPGSLRLSPNSVVLDRLGLLEPIAMQYIEAMAERARVLGTRNSGKQLTPQEQSVDRVARRLWGARVLLDRLRDRQQDEDPNACSAASVRQKWGVSEFDQEELIRCAEGFASTMTAFCERLGAWAVHAALRSFIKRVHLARDGGQQLAALTDIKVLSRPQARMLFDAGCKTLQAVAGLERGWLRDQLLRQCEKHRDPASNQLPPDVVAKAADTAMRTIQHAKDRLGKQQRQYQHKQHQQQQHKQQLSGLAGRSLAAPSNALTVAVPVAAAAATATGAAVLRSAAAAAAVVPSAKTGSGVAAAHSASLLPGPSATGQLAATVPAAGGAAAAAMGAGASPHVPEGKHVRGSDFLQQPLQKRQRQQQDMQLDAQQKQQLGRLKQDPEQEIQEQQQQQQQPALKQEQQAPQDHQQQPQPSVPPLGAQPGLTVIKTAAAMQQLIATLAAAPSWGFSLHLNQPLPAPPAPAVAPSAREGTKRGGSVHGRARSVPSGAALTAAAATAGTRRKWRWDLLGVAFSTCDGCAFYVPLYAADAQGKDRSVRSSRCPQNVRQMWAGLQEIFGGSRDKAPCSSGSSSSAEAVCGPRQQVAHSRVPAVAAAAKAVAAADPASSIALLHSFAVTPIKSETASSAGAAPAAAAAGPDVSVGCSASSWLAPAPVCVTFGLRSALQLLSDPPAASGLAGLQLCGCPIVDVRVAAYLLDSASEAVEESSGGPDCEKLTLQLKNLLEPEAGFAVEGDWEAAVNGFGAAGQQQQQVEPVGVLRACQRAAAAHRLYQQRLLPRLEEQQLLPLLMGVEMPLVYVLSAMSHNGMAFSSKAIKEQLPPLDSRVSALLEQAAQYIKSDDLEKVLWNKVQSSDALSNVLYGTVESGGLGLIPPVDTAKGASGRYSTDKEALKALSEQHPLPGIILQFRKLGHHLAEMHRRLEEAAATEAALAVSAASCGPAAAADNAAAAASGLVRVHCCWLQTCHAGGRLSSGTRRSAVDHVGMSLQCTAKNIEYELHSTVVASQRGAAADSDSDCSSSDSDNDEGSAKVPAALGPAAAAAAAAGGAGARGITAAPKAAAAPAATGGAGRSAATAAAAAAAAGSRPQHGAAELQRVQMMTASVRSGFAAPAGSVIMSADYSQMEMRLMASFSGDPALLQAFRSGEDCFKAVAAQWLKKSSCEEVSVAERAAVKQVLYGLAYGAGSGRLATVLGMPMLKAQQLAEDFKGSHPVLMAFLQGVVDRARRNGYLQTIGGRRRWLPYINSPDWEKRGHNERVAINGTVQGSAADMVKGAMCQLCSDLKEQGLSNHCKMLAQLHDELVFEISSSHLPQVAALVRRVMEGVAEVWGLQVAMPVKVSVGPSWGQLVRYA